MTGRQVKPVLASLHCDNFAYHPRGKIVRAWSTGDSTANIRSGLGMLAWSYTDVYAVAGTPVEVHLTDALGNTYRMRCAHLTPESDALPLDTTVYQYVAGTGRLCTMVSEKAAWAVAFDHAGNQYLSSAADVVTYRV